MKREEHARLTGKLDGIDDTVIETIAARLYSVWHWRGESRESVSSEQFRMLNKDQRKRWKRLAVETILICNEHYKDQ